MVVKPTMSEKKMVTDVGKDRSKGKDWDNGVRIVQFKKTMKETWKLYI